MKLRSNGKSTKGIEQSISELSADLIELQNTGVDTTARASIASLAAQVDTVFNITPTTNLFTGPYRSDCYVDGYYEPYGTIKAATGGTGRTFVLTLTENHYYRVKAPGPCSRFRISLNDAIYAGTDVPGTLLVDDATKTEWTFFSGSSLYAYIYVSNTSVDVAITIHDMTNDHEMINVKGCGAVGDGTTDDTEALQTALILARCGNGVLYFPTGTYMTHRALYLKSNMLINGAKGAIVKKFPAVTTTNTVAVAADATTVTVASVTGFAVGQDIQIVKSVDAARDATPAVITAIDEANKIISFSSYYGKSATTTYSIGSSVTSSFAILRTNAVREKGENITIENLTLDSNKQAGEPAEWSLSTIHIDPDDRGIHLQSQNTIKIIDCVILNSPADGISAQCDGIVEIEGCTIDTCMRHGIHLGSSCTDATVFNNRIENCVLDGVFWCQDVYGARVISNYIKACGQGCAADTFGTPGYDSVIANNVFDDITGYGVNIDDWEGVVCTGNIFKAVNATAIYAQNAIGAAISNNVMKGFTEANIVAMNLNSSSNVTLTGNVVINPTGTAYIATSASNLTAAGNNFVAS